MLSSQAYINNADDAEATGFASIESQNLIQAGPSSACWIDLPGRAGAVAVPSEAAAGISLDVATTITFTSSVCQATGPYFCETDKVRGGLDCVGKYLPSAHCATMTDTWAVPPCSSKGLSAVGSTICDSDPTWGSAYVNAYALYSPLMICSGPGAECTGTPSYDMMTETFTWLGTRNC